MLATLLIFLNIFKYFCSIDIACEKFARHLQKIPVVTSSSNANKKLRLKLKYFNFHWVFRPGYFVKFISFYLEIKIVMENILLILIEFFNNGKKTEGTMFRLLIK